MAAQKIHLVMAPSDLCDLISTEKRESNSARKKGCAVTGTLLQSMLRMGQQEDLNA